MRKYRMAVVAAAVCAAAAVGGCAVGREAAKPVETVVETTAELPSPSETEESVAAETGKSEEPSAAVESTAELAVIEDQPVPLYEKPVGSHVRVPQASDTVTYGNGKVAVDASNSANGYVMVKYTGSKGKIKVQITKGGITYTYDLNARDAYEVFPFSEGNGTYSVKVFENVTGNQYAQAFSQDISVSLADQFEPFLYPNQYVNFTENCATVQTGAQIAASATDAIGVVTDVYNYVIGNIHYDNAKAASVQSGYLPNVDEVLASKKGICFDYAALMTAMLRSQDIPAKLVIGYTGSLYHAWVNVYIDNVGWVDNMIYFDGTNWSLMDPTFASSGGNDESVRQYIGNGANYQAKYTY